MLPRIIYAKFPLANDDQDYNNPIVKRKNVNFSIIDAETIRNLGLEDFEMMVDTPVVNDSPIKIQQEWKMANDNSIPDIKRGIFIDRLASSNDKDVIRKLLKMYAETTIPELKTRIIVGTQSYYQNHINEINSNNDKELLKNFYSELLTNQLSEQAIPAAVRGYMVFHTPTEVLDNIVLINSQLYQIKGKMLLGLKISLMRLSIDLERIYIKKIISQLLEDKDMTEDSMFFYFMNESYKYLKDPQSISIIKSYLAKISTKYTAENFNKNDINLYFARKYFIEMNNNFKQYKTSHP